MNPPASHLPTVIHWFRRDLRITDNPALLDAASFGLPVVPVYFTSNWLNDHPWTGANRQHFLCECLQSLDRSLTPLNGRLIIRHGDAISGLRKLITETQATAVCFNHSPDPFGKQQEILIRLLCSELRIECRSHHDTTLHDSHEVLTQNQQPYRVFTPYYRNWQALPKPTPSGSPTSLNTPPHLTSNPLPTTKLWNLTTPTFSLEASESAASSRLNQLIQTKVGSYANRRDIPSAEGTSRISQDLRHGLISIRTVLAAILNERSSATAAARASIDVFIKELAWREFYMAILHHFPHVLHEEFNPDWRGLPWTGPGPLFELWKHGQTGFPIVDAGMRELLATGHMHNRVRMIAAMFLTKDLHIDWKLGESHFMQQLLDGEIASNNGGWQWSAGTGADAAPYFRIQNPWTQGARYDADGHYIKRWIPELREIHPSRLHRPPAEGEILAKHYPPPCVDHAQERSRTLAIFKEHRAQQL